MRSGGLIFLAAVQHKTNETRSPLTATGDAVTQERSAPTFVLFTPKEAATRLKVSESFLAKARMRGDGPPYIMIGRSSNGCGRSSGCRPASNSCPV